MNQEIRLPQLTMEQAIDLAHQHLAENDIDLSLRFLTGSSWNSMHGSDKAHWSLEWMTAEQFEKRQMHPRLRGGGHLCVQVFDDSRVAHSFAR